MNLIEAGSSNTTDTAGHARARIFRAETEERANRRPEAGRPDDHLEPRSRRQIASGDKLLGGPEGVSRRRSAGIGLAAGLRLGAGTRPAAELLRAYIRND